MATWRFRRRSRRFSRPGSTGSCPTSAPPSSARRSRVRSSTTTRSRGSFPKRSPGGWSGSNSRSSGRTSSGRPARTRIGSSTCCCGTPRTRRCRRSSARTSTSASPQWLEVAVPEVEEIRGYHLEQAYRYRAELGPVDERALELARRASTLLAAAGRRAAHRADVPATINLLERAVSLLPDGDPEAVAIYPDLGTALMESGDLRRPEQLFRDAERLGDETTALRARLERIWLDLYRGAPMAEAVGLLERTIEEAERIGDEAILAEALGHLGTLQMWLGDNEEAERLLRRSLEHADAVGNHRLRSEAMRWIALVMLWGSTPVDEALQQCRAFAQADRYRPDGSRRAPRRRGHAARVDRRVRARPAAGRRRAGGPSRARPAGPVRGHRAAFSDDRTARRGHRGRRAHAAGGA